MPFVAVIYATDSDQARELIHRYTDADGERGRIVGVYEMPKAGTTPTCEGSCSAGIGWGRDHTNGHLVHACGKRVHDWRRRIARALFDTFGINTLPRSITPKLFQNPKGWGI